MFRHWTNALECVKVNPSGLRTGVLVLQNRRIDATIKAAANVIVKHTSMRLRARRKLTTGTTFTRLIQTPRPHRPVRPTTTNGFGRRPRAGLANT